MTEKLLSDYIKATEFATYPDFSIEDIQCDGGWVLFKERDSSGYYTEDHRIHLLNLLAWVYGKVGS